MILVWVLVASFLLCGLAMALGQSLDRRAGWVLSGGFLVLAGVLGWVRATGIATDIAVRWLPSLDISLRLRMDGLSFIFAEVVLIIGAAVMAYAVYYLPPGRHGAFYTLLSFFATAMLTLVFSNDLVLTWVAWEFTTLTSFLLISQSGPKGRDPAIRTLLVTGLGGLCLLGAVALTVASTGTTVLDDALASPLWASGSPRVATIAVLVACAAFTKSAQWPFHAWLPDAMVASTPVSAYLHAAAMVKAGIYLLLRFSTALASVPVWNVLLVSIGLTTALMGSVFALQRFDLKELLAYSTVSQLGFLVACIGVGTSYAMIGALVHVVAHAFFKSGLFMSVGLIDHEASTRDMRRLSGLRHTMPATSTVMVLACASMAGLPPFFGFVSKEAMFKAFSQAPWGTGAAWVCSIVAVAAALGTFAYSARLLRPLFGDPHSPVVEKTPHEAPAGMIAPAAVVALAGVVFGLVGNVLAPLIESGVQVINGAEVHAELELWHGVNAPLIMSVVVILGGCGLVAARRQVDAVLVDRRLFPTTAVEVIESTRSGIMTGGHKVGNLTRVDAPFGHLIAPLSCLVVLVGVMAPQLGLGLPDTQASSQVSHGWDWLWLVIVAVGVLLTVIARSRVALVTTVGVVGFTTSLLFFVLGAPDVALTQLLVEILTVVVMVLLLARLPRSFHPSRRSRSILALVFAIAVGAAGFVLALVVQNPGELSTTGRYYLDHATELTGGTNIVNTILVEFRAFDTFGETVVLGMAGIFVVVALESRGLLPHASNPILVADSNPAADPVANTMQLRVILRLFGPLLALLSLWFLIRGHYQPGGGFIAALVAGAAICLVYLASSDDRVPGLHGRTTAWIGVGILIASGVGLIGMAAGAFLTPFSVRLAGLGISSSLLFDLGVYATVLGLLATALGRLGVDADEPPPTRKRGEVTTQEGS